MNAQEPKNQNVNRRSYNTQPTTRQYRFDSGININVNKTQSHFLAPSEILEKITRRVIAPYAQIERKSMKEDEEKPGKSYLEMNRFHVFLGETVDMEALLYETAKVLKTVTDSSGVFVYIVDNLNNEIVLMHPDTLNPERHEINIPIEMGKSTAAHVAATKQYLLLDDVQRDKTFSEGLKWVEAKVALCMPIVKPDGECYAVLEFFRTYAKPFDENVLYTVVSVACWAGAAVHQARARIILQKTAHLNTELRQLLQKYFSDLASIDTMLTDMLAIVKTFIGAMRSSFYILDREHVGRDIIADMWVDGWSLENTTMPKKKTKVNLSEERSPARLVAETGVPLNVVDSYRDPRFAKEVDATTGTVSRSCLVSPILDKDGVIGVVQLTNKTNATPFDSEDEQIFAVFINYCSLIVHFHVMQQRKMYHSNLNQVFSELMGLHLKPCKHQVDDLLVGQGLMMPPANFRSFDYYITDSSPEEIPSLICYMFTETLGTTHFDKTALAKFTLTVIKMYRNNAYHNAEHAFCFTHTMFLIVVKNPGFFDFVETVALLLGGLCHDMDHPGFNNNFLSLSKHPLAGMYKTSILEHHHYFLAKKIIEDQQILKNIPPADQHRIMEEIKYNILCTDLAVYFQIRAQLTPVLAEDQFDWNDQFHRSMLKGIIMTTSDLSGCCKPFGTSKVIAESVYKEFYLQGDQERAMGYIPLSMMDRNRSINQPAEQIQFLSVVVLPCLLLTESVFPNTNGLTQNCRKTQDAWHEEIEIRGQRLWRQSDCLTSHLTKFMPHSSNTASAKSRDNSTDDA